MPAGNIVGVDPHRRRFTATILDERGAVIATEHFDNDLAGHVNAATLANDHGPIQRWGVENAASLGRHLAEFLIEDGIDVRDVAPHRTARR